MSIIVVKNISKQFKVGNPLKQAITKRFSNLLHRPKKREFQPVQNVSFKLKKGESLGIIGKNGAGKTTLLKTISGIYKTDTGTVSINGKALFLANMSNGMNARLSVKDNVHLMSSILGLSAKQIQEIYDKIIDFSGLNDFVDYKIYQLSSGMKQRLAFSTVIHCVEVLDPEIILLDEVLSGGGGDEEYKNQANEKVQALLKSGKTMIMVSHSLNAIKEHCKHVIWMHQGKVKMKGRPERVTKSYVEFIKKSKQSKKPKI